MCRHRYATERAFFDEDARARSDNHVGSLFQDPEPDALQDSLIREETLQAGVVGERQGMDGLDGRWGAAIRLSSQQGSSGPYAHITHQTSSPGKSFNA